MAETPARTAVVIAVDGPAASGKGTLARRLAAHFGYAHLDTGLLYRALGLRMLRAGLDPHDAGEAARLAVDITMAELDDPALRHEETANAAGVVAAMPAVRQAVLRFQRDFIACPPGGAGGAVLDGRDIGTVICPGADYKFFLEASPGVRAERRLKELQQRGVESIHSRVLQDMNERDARDRGRRVAPLVPAEDAHLLDTTRLDADAAFAAALEFITSRNASQA
jgi:cytidylate kinase